MKYHLDINFNKLNGHLVMKLLLIKFIIFASQQS